MLKLYKYNYLGTIDKNDGDQTPGTHKNVSKFFPKESNYPLSVFESKHLFRNFHNIYLTRVNYLNNLEMKDRERSNSHF